jgi:hypothetical protein
VVGFLIIPLISAVPFSFADTGTCGSYCSVSVSPGSGGSGSTFQITTTVTIPAGSVGDLFLFAVLTPTGDVYTCGPINSPCQAILLDNVGGSTSATGTCTIPYGSIGTLTSTGATVDCSGSSEWVKQTAINTLSLLESTCESQIIGSYAFTPTVAGPTTTTGTYTVFACWSIANTGGPPLYATTTFTVTSIGVPQFAIPTLNTILLVALLLPALVILSKKFAAKQVRPLP